MADKPALVAVDWGTTSFRAYLAAADGAVLDRVADDKGILAVTAGRFADVLSKATAPWIAAHGSLPILMSGMIGSRQGWVEAPYVKCPADVKAIAQRLTKIEVDGLGAVALVPGLETRGPDGAPDVLRGEETQVFGVLQAPGARDGLYVLPGTHSKWVTVKGGAILGFRTYMTGEVFAVLRGHSILGRLMTPRGGGGPGFAKGLEAGRSSGLPGDLLSRLFSVRTLGLFGEVPPPELADYLSGLLIGAELTAGAAGGKSSFTIVAGAELSDRYVRAAALLGLSATAASADSVVPGHLAIARTAGLMGRQ
jgi:2-dehydro-3-deoxygalactonokinase